MFPTVYHRRRHHSATQPSYPKSFFDTALEADKIASDNINLFQKREFLKKVGSNLTLKDRIVDCDLPEQWAALSRRPTSRNRVQREGFEPS